MTETTKTNRESFIFYRSFFEALTGMDKQSQADCLMAIADYALNGTDPNLTPEVRMFFTLVKPQLDANTKKYENGFKGAKFGKMGGRPRKNPIETPEKPQENPNRTPNDNDNVNDNVNVNEKETDKENEKEKNVGPEKVRELIKSFSESKSSSFNKKNKILVSESLSLLDFNDGDLPVHLYLAEYGEKVILDVQNWLIHNKLGQNVDKEFICRQFNNFANRQRR